MNFMENLGQVQSWSQHLLEMAVNSCNNLVHNWRMKRGKSLTLSPSNSHFPLFLKHTWPAIPVAFYINNCLLARKRLLCYSSTADSNMSDNEGFTTHILDSFSPQPVTIDPQVILHLNLETANNSQFKHYPSIPLPSVIRSFVVYERLIRCP